MVLAPHLAKLRILRGYSQTRLADLIGVQPNYISMVERGTRCPSVPVVMAWTGACGAQLAIHLVDPRWTKKKGRSG